MEVKQMQIASLEFVWRAKRSISSPSLTSNGKVICPGGKEIPNNTQGKDVFSPIPSFTTCPQTYVPTFAEAGQTLNLHKGF